jgi:hypothetical protein
VLESPARLPGEPKVILKEPSCPGGLGCSFSTASKALIVVTNLARIARSAPVFFAAAIWRSTAASHSRSSMAAAEAGRWPGRLKRSSYAPGFPSKLTY